MVVSDYSHPVLSCEDAQAFEKQFLDSADSEWAAMLCAGLAIARTALSDYTELRAVPDGLRVLALVGKGHNGGDALIACGEFLAQYPRAKVHLLMSCDVDTLKPLARKAYDQLKGRVTNYFVESKANVVQIRAELDVITGGSGFHICVDGLTGMSFKPPLRAPSDAMVAAVNGYPKIDLRLAIDLPSGIGDSSGHLYFHADFCYATGITKQPVLDGDKSGRVRYMDLGFFDEATLPNLHERVITEKVLERYRRFRPSNVDKRHYGHLFIVGGSVSMPGALMMSVQAAVRSGVGRVTVFAPESVAGYLAAQVPEAMWVPMLETEAGTLSAQGFSKLEPMLSRATALLMGPGMGQHVLTEILLKQIIYNVELPMVLDADALQAGNLSALKVRKSPTVLTPHMGEFQRLSAGGNGDEIEASLRELCVKYGVCTVLKGPHSRICDGRDILWNLSGGPVLARGGSGDVLAGLLGGILAEPKKDPMLAAAEACMLHGMAADALARAKGQTFVRATDLLDYLAVVTRAEL